MHQVVQRSHIVEHKPYMTTQYLVRVFNADLLYFVLLSAAKAVKIAVNLVQIEMRLQ